MSGRTAREEGINRYYERSVSEDERRLESVKGFAFEKALHELRIPLTDDLKGDIFSRLKVDTAVARGTGAVRAGLGGMPLPTPDEIQQRLIAVEDDPRFPTFATSPYQEKGGVKVDEPHRATQPLSAMGRAVYPQVHRQVMFRLAEDRAHRERLGKEFPKSFIEGRNPKG
tara:strand:+ start:383 stop:892 length:510 start_codon:yes stop_codon:yes gene_type:complete